MPDLLVWAGIFICLSQSAMFSGLNLAVFGIGRLRLEVDSLWPKVIFYAELQDLIDSRLRNPPWVIFCDRSSLP